MTTPSRMTKEQIITAAVELPEYERKQIVLALTASTLTEMAYADAVEMADKANAEVSA